MNLVFFHFSLQSGGAERMIARLSDYAVQHGHTVTVLTMDDRESFYKLNPGVSHVRLGIAASSRNALQGVIHNITSVKVVRTALKQIRPDKVICFGPNTVLLSYLARGSMKFALIGSERSNPYMNQNGRNFWSKSKRRLSKLCDGYIFQTRGAQSYYPESTQKKSEIIGNAVIASEFSHFDRPWPERVNICAVGRMQSEKSFHDLITAFSTVHRQYPDVCLDMYGDGPLRGELERLTTELGLQDRVMFHGRCDNIYGEYAKHRLFVMTSISEGMPNVLLEAMASGCACVSSDCDFGPSEIIHDGEDGFLVPVHDCDAIADRICRLLGDGELCMKFSDAAKSVRQTFDISAVGEKFLKYVVNVNMGRRG